jgi:transcription elongation factor Elf1
LIDHPKHQYVRSKKLLRLVAELECQLCGSHHFVQAAHSNWGSGKGRGIKADDNMVAALCMNCHHDIDQGHQWSKQERQRAWWIAHRKTVEILVEQGCWPLDVPIPDGTEWDGFIPLQ